MDPSKDVYGERVNTERRGPETRGRRKYAVGGG